MARTTRSKPSKPAGRKTAAKKRSSAAKTKAVAATPLLASSPKKVGKVAGTTNNAPYQPRTAPKARAVTPPTMQYAGLDPLAPSRMWMQMGAQMALSALSFQARIAGNLLSSPPAALALRQGAAAYAAWLGLLHRAPTTSAPKKARS
jgi:predicted Zn-dependent protease